MKTLLFVCLLGIGVTQSSGSCENEVEQCLQDVEAIITQIIVEMKTTETDLDHICLYTNEVLKCLSKCEKDIPKASTPIYTRTKKFKSSFCVKGADMRKLFLETSPCLNKNLQKIHMCNSDDNSYSTEFSTPNSQNLITENVNSEHSENCRYFCDNMDCIYKASEKHCGSDGVKLFKALTDPLNALMDVNCNHSCSSPSGSSVITFSNWLSVIAICSFLICRIL